MIIRNLISWFTFSSIDQFYRLLHAKYNMMGLLPTVAIHPFRLTTNHSLGKQLPYQLAT